jgi:hypothetical protein
MKRMLPLHTKTGVYRRAERRGRVVAWSTKELEGGAHLIEIVNMHFGAALREFGRLPAASSCQDGANRKTSVGRKRKRARAPAGSCRRRRAARWKACYAPSISASY